MTETDLQYLWERFHHPGIFVAVHLYRVDERHLRLWVVTERFENFRKPLQGKENKKNVTDEVRLSSCGVYDERRGGYGPRPP